MARTNYWTRDMSDMKQIQVLSELVSRALLSAKLGKSYGTDRDLYEALGYPTELKYEDFYTQYTRHDIAKAVIDRPVHTTWRGGFEIVESKEANETALEKEFKTLSKQVKLHSAFSRLDKLTGLGKYGVLLLGFDDVKSVDDFRKPVSPGKRMLLYVKPLGEGSAPIDTWDQDPSSERYCYPEQYKIRINNPSASAYVELQVHHTRVIHVVDEMMESEIEGSPRLEVVFNRCMDLEKLTGGSAEMFWRGAYPGYQGKVDPEYTMTTETKEALQDQIDEFEHHLRRIMVNEGVSLEPLTSNLSDPANYVDIQFQMISAATHIPKRILTGSERGELASSQDSDNWDDYITSRREEFAEQNIIIPFIQKMMLYKVLTTVPEDKYTIEWKSLYESSDKEKAEVGKIRADALNAYASNPAAEAVVPPQAFFEFFLGFDQDQIDLIMEMQQDAMDEEERFLATHPELVPEEPEPGEVKKKNEVSNNELDLYRSGNFGHGGRPGKVGGSAKTRAQMSSEELKADIASTTEAKWTRNVAFTKEHAKLMGRINKDFDSSEEAKVLYLISQTGFRVGGERIRGKNQVFGASTLRPEHVTIANGIIGFNFLGKKSVQQDLEIFDLKLSEVLQGRMGQDRIFDTNSDKVLKYMKSISDGKYLVKDFRTYVATEAAHAAASAFPVPSTKKQKNAYIKQISTKVSSILGNTPSMAKNSYINPKVWTIWE